MGDIQIDVDRIEALADAIGRLSIPAVSESATHTLGIGLDSLTLANCYLAIVSICHQTSPVGGIRAQGYVGGQLKVGWDYLKERFLARCLDDSRWSTPSHWIRATSDDLVALYEDEVCGSTLCKPEERARLLNGLGSALLADGAETILEVFSQRGRRLGGPNGFLGWLGGVEAYGDPAMKKTMLFLAIVVAECGWLPVDPECMVSPVDYHEVRGHLRLGTVRVRNPRLLAKVRDGVSLDANEDVGLRLAVQRANDSVATRVGVGADAIHYLIWNVIRNCCPREGRAHCDRCGKECALPPLYAETPGYDGRCLFAEACSSAHRSHKLLDPPYDGHYY